MAPVAKPTATNKNIQIDHTTIAAKLVFTAFIELITAVIISTRRSIIICGAKAESENTVTSNTPPIMPVSYTHLRAHET